MSDSETNQQAISEAFDDMIKEATELPASLTIPIAPIEHAGTTYTEITVREPTIKQRRQASEKLRSNLGPEAAEVDYWIWLVHLTSGAPHELVSQIAVSRINIARRYLQLFLGYGLQTGPM